MIRLVFFAVLTAVLVVIGVLVVTILLSVFAAKSVMGPRDMMPSPIQKISYVALVILLIGLSVGWIGGA